ncbi:hypothetical protein [Kitasatospora sp. KL5]|uniref:hypothetical protein n=1 Tax=Kitasatospora sp. KL5 TaxID=3425125 RepID=UPI003D6F7E6F
MARRHGNRASCGCTPGRLCPGWCGESPAALPSPRSPRPVLDGHIPPRRPGADPEPQGASRYNNGAALNGNLFQDVSCLHQSQNHYGLGVWFAGHRNGASGLAGPNTADIDHHKAAVYWIKAQIDADSANLGNDTRFWVQVPAI